MSSAINSKIIHELKLLLELRKVEKDTFRIRALTNGIKAIERLDYKINISNVDKLKEIDGIGKGIFDRIVEILKTGELAELELASAIEAVQQLEKMNELEQVSGIGAVKAKKLYEEGIKTVAELRDAFYSGKVGLTAHQQIGLKYYSDFLQRIPRSEIDKFAKILKKAVSVVSKEIGKTIDYEIVGSYRREKKESGDIDVLFTLRGSGKDDGSTDKLLGRLVELLEKEKILIDTLSKGKSKYMGVGRIIPDGSARRVDFLLISEEEYPFAVLYFTGSGEFNVKMRAHAKSKDLRLNEHGLLDKNKKAIPGLKSEKDIFKYLEMEYLEPKDRI